MIIKLINWMDRTEKITLYVIMILGISMLIVAWAHIFYRYFLNNSLSWSEEFLRICLVWFSLLSATLITKRSEHIGIVIFRDRMPRKVQEVLILLVHWLMVVSCAIVTIVGLNLVFKSFGQVSPALNIPYSFSYAAIPVSFLIMFLYEIIHIINRRYIDKKVDNLINEAQ